MFLVFVNTSLVKGLLKNQNIEGASIAQQSTITLYILDLLTSIQYVISLSVKQIYFKIEYFLYYIKFLLRFPFKFIIFAAVSIKELLYFIPQLRLLVFGANSSNLKSNSTLKEVFLFYMIKYYIDVAE